MSRLINLTGQVFGRLTALRYVGDCRWLCRCDCGQERRVHTSDLRVGKTVSCGAHKADLARANFTKHGLSGAPEHQIWRAIKKRCLNPNNKAFAYYGGRGITICDAWRESFAKFFADVGPRPSPQHSIDRRDNTRGYEPGNCHWATPQQQAANRRPRSRKES